MKPMSSYHVLHIIFRPQHRGVELSAVQMVGSMSEHWENAICSLFRSKLEIPIDVQYKLDVSPGRITRIFGFNWLVFWRLLKVKRRYKPQIIVAHGGDALRYAAALKLVNKKGSLFIYKCAGFPTTHRQRRIKFQLSRILIKLSDVVVCIGQICRQEFLRYYDLSPDKVVSIDEGVDTLPFDQMDYKRTRVETRNTLGYHSEDIILINVGSLSPVKNQTQLVSLVGTMYI